MKMDDLFPSKYLKASDADPALTLTIDKITQEVMKNRDDQDETKAVIYFREVQKPMVLNRTNAKTIANMYGDDTDDWIGQRVILTTAIVDAFGQAQAALRIDPRKPAPDKRAILDRYAKLYQRGVTFLVEGIEDYEIGPDMTEAEIIALGKELKVKVEAAEKEAEAGF